jgi:hypothetical protein
MNCPECGKESTLEDKVMSIDYYICEFCGHYFGYLNCGQATEKQVDSMRSNYQRQIEYHIKDSGRAKRLKKLIEEDVELMKPGDILIRTEPVDKKLPEGLELESDVILRDWTHLPGNDGLSAVAFFNKHGSRRLAKADSETAIEVLEELTGYKWQVDGVSNFVIHLEQNQIEVRKNGILGKENYNAL